MQTGNRFLIHIMLLSADTDHSFWVPQLAGKTDLIPNRKNEMWIEPHEVGTYVGQCAQYCGTQHAKMLLSVVVQSPEDFQRWVEEQKAPAVNVCAGGREGRQRVRGQCLHELPHHHWDYRQWAVWSRPDAPDEPKHDRFRRGSQQ